jgi:hypothetical protein
MVALTGIEGANHQFSSVQLSPTDSSWSVGMAKPWQNSPQIPDVVTRLSLVELQAHGSDLPKISSGEAGNLEQNDSRAPISPRSRLRTGRLWPARISKGCRESELEVLSLRPLSVHLCSRGRSQRHGCLGGQQQERERFLQIQRTTDRCDSGSRSRRPGRCAGRNRRRAWSVRTLRR